MQANWSTKTNLILFHCANFRRDCSYKERSFPEKWDSIQLSKHEKKFYWLSMKKSFYCSSVYVLPHVPETRSFYLFYCRNKLYNRFHTLPLSNQPIFFFPWKSWKYLIKRLCIVLSSFWIKNCEQVDLINFCIWIWSLNHSRIFQY